MTDVLIKRELLERLAAYMRQRVCPAPSGKVATELHADLTAALAAPRQPEGDYSITPNLQDVTVVGYAAQQDIDWHGDCTLRKTAMLDYDTPLCRLSDAQRVIAELRAENARLVERTGYLVEFAQQMARQQGEPYYRLLAKAALKKWSGL